MPIRFPLPPVIAAVLASLSPLCAQAANEFDFEPALLGANAIVPNGATHTIAGTVVYTGQHLTLAAPLVIPAGAELRLVQTALEVRGNVTLQEGGRLTLVDASLLLPCASQRQYEFVVEGGVLQTERSVLGSGYVNGSLAQTRLLHLRGTWLARQTVAQGLVTILADGRIGWFGNPLQKGGAVFADGLFEGDRTDAIHLSGMGDVTLANGAMNVGFYFDAAASAGPSATTIDLDSRSYLNVAYGDPLVHRGVTQPMARSAYRLELQHHRVPTWQFFAINASSTGPLQTLTLHAAEDVLCNLRGADLVGTPVLGGPWASHYATLPGLPSTARPGHHAMPPGCSVRLGNVQFQSGPGPNDWNRIRAWGLYARGATTNLAVTGPTHIAEINLTSGQIHLQGTGSFDMGVFANTIRLYQGAVLDITNGSLGEFGTTNGTVGLFELQDNSTCTLSTVRTAPVRLRTMSAAASIVAQNVFGVQNLILEPNAGTITVTQATPTQSTDLQNLGFESPLLAGGVPPYWASASLTGTLVPHAMANGSNAYRATVQASGATLQKLLLLPLETSVDVVAQANVAQAPASGALRFETANGASLAAGTIGLSNPNTWRAVQVPSLVVGSAGATAVRFLATGAPATVALDDVRVQVGSWWDHDNLANLNLDGECRWGGQAPTYWSSPDGFRSFQVVCAPASGVFRPGSPGSRSLQLTLQASYGSFYKDLTFLRAGETVVLRGWCRGVSARPGAAMQVLVGNGQNYYAVGFGNNVQSGPIACNGNWQQFTLTYLVPNNPSFTRLDFGLYDAPGTQCWYDDLTVEIQ